MAELKKLLASDVPNGVPPAGHYSPAVIHNGTVYVSGQLARVPGSDVLPEGIAAQTTQCLLNAENILRAAGSDRNHVIRATLYISDIADWTPVNTAFAEFFGDHKPARSIIPVNKFKSTFLIEIDIVAAVTA
ncbi:MAG: RidA family protein [Betaproteobacteria bacterium]|nr:RidA family protein [Betaproteobacteria bacterium]